MMLTCIYCASKDRPVISGASSMPMTSSIVVATSHRAALYPAGQSSFRSVLCITNGTKNKLITH